MPVLGITGGIATGKTTFTRRLVKVLNGEVFDADASARELLQNNEAVIAAVVAAFGEGVVDETGQISRPRLREIVFQDPAKRKALEAIIHPAVREEWKRKAGQLESSPTWFLVDHPLLYETGADQVLKQVVVVACSASTQRSRLLKERGLPPHVADGILSAQWPLGEKIKRADFLVWSDTPLAQLDVQATQLANLLMR